jgi:hypothetical protein
MSGQPSTNVETAKRIPTTLPFVLRHSVPKFGLFFGGWAVVNEGAVALVAGEFITVWWAHLLIVGLPLLCLLNIIFRGPTLAMDSHGVWIAVRGWPRPRAVRIPWHDVSMIVRARYQWHTAVGVQPRSLGALIGSLGAIGFLNTNKSQQLYGAAFNTSLTLGDRSAEEVARAVHTLATVPVTLRGFPVP